MSATEQNKWADRFLSISAMTGQQQLDEFARFKADALSGMSWDEWDEIKKQLVKRDL